MKCPYCHKQTLYITNSRPTKKNSQIWRRKWCSSCNLRFTTHEIIDLSHLVVVKKSGDKQRFNKIKLYSGIYGATIGSKTPNREKVVEKITEEVENNILFSKKKIISSQEIGDLVLHQLRKTNIATFMRFLAYHKNLRSLKETQKEISKYLEI